VHHFNQAAAGRRAAPDTGPTGPNGPTVSEDAHLHHCKPVDRTTHEGMKEESAARR